MRTLIYARFSSTLQNSTSITDQLALCRERCAAEGWTIVGEYTDAAISGAAGIESTQRPELNELLARVERGDINQVLCEMTSRIARHQGDSFTIREHLQFYGTRLFTLAQGEIDDLKGLMNGYTDANQRKDLAFTIKRRQSGVVREGRIAAGLAYGYRKAPQIDDRGNVVHGFRTIDEDQAAIVRRIFTAIADGYSARQIANQLNAEKIPSPSGRLWKSTTIWGDRKRGAGILQNRAYVGEIVHNRTAKVMNPKTRKTLIRPRPESEWIVSQAPDLRIVDDATWQRVQEVRGEGYSTFRMARRPRRLLSGMGTCGVCGGSWIIGSSDKWLCSNHRTAGDSVCSNRRMISTAAYERRVLRGLREKMLDPAAVDHVVREYHRFFAQRSRELGKSRSRLERQHRDASARIDRLVDIVAEGGGSFEEFRERLTVAKADRDRIAAELAAAEVTAPIALHPKVADDYRNQVAALEEALSSSKGKNARTIERLRALIDTIVMTPAQQGRGVDIEVTGKMGAILSLATGVTLPKEGTFVMERAKGIEPSS